MEETKKHVTFWTRKEFKALPEREWNEDIGEFDALVILPAKIYDANCRAIELIAVRLGIPICKLSYSQEIYLDGLAGRVFQRDKGSWAINCLRKSGLLQVYTRGSGKLVAGNALSIFELFTKE